MEDEEKQQIGDDIRNKLSPMKNLLAILKDSKLVYHQNPQMHKLATKEVEQCEKSIEYLSKLL